MEEETLNSWRARNPEDYAYMMNRAKKMFTQTYNNPRSPTECYSTQEDWKQVLEEKHSYETPYECRICGYTGPWKTMFNHSVRLITRSLFD